MISLDNDPTFIKKGSKLLLNLLNFSEGKVILKVIDSDGRELYNESLEGKVVVEKAFNFRKCI